jgi:hypothetical protein
MMRTCHAVDLLLRKARRLRWAGHVGLIGRQELCSFVGGNLLESDHVEELEMGIT